MSAVTEYRNAPPWDWDEKAADFIKPGDAVLHLWPGTDLSALPAEGFQVVLSRGPVWNPVEIRRLLQPGGFFLAECVGGEDSRALAEFLLPGSRPAVPVNLENQAPLLQAAGFRIMYRNQAYPVRRFTSLEDLLRYIACFPERFPGFSQEACAQRLKLLEKALDARGYVENTEHRFLLIGKKK